MTNEEQIKQAANEYATTQGGLLTEKTGNAFIAGANLGREIGMKEAFEWKSIKDDLPDECYDRCLWKDEKGHIWYGRAYESQKPTHWRPINFEDFIKLQK